MDKRENFKCGVTLNKSDVFIAPMLWEIETAIRSSNKFPQSCFKATFVGDASKPGFENNKILLLYKLPMQSVLNVDMWNNFEVFLQTIPGYIEDYKVDKEHRMFAYEIPEEWKEDYKTFLEWKPSQFSHKYKERVNKFYGDLKKNKPGNPILGIMYKSEERFKALEQEYGISIPRDQEASSTPYWDEEYFQEEYKVVNALEKESYG